METKSAAEHAATDEVTTRRLVRYVGTFDEQVRWGGNDDPRGLLVEGSTYEIKRVEAHSWHTKYELVEFPGKAFNSLSFKHIADEA